MKTYRGVPTGYHRNVTVETVGGAEGARCRPLSLRLDLCNDSPSGFNWGYGGAGPAQLALALLADYLGDDARAMRLAGPFKWRVVAGLDHREAWTLTSNQVQQEIADIEAEQRWTHQEIAEGEAERRWTAEKTIQWVH